MVERAGLYLDMNVAQTRRIAIGPHVGRKALTLYSVPPLEDAHSNPLLARMSGFSLKGNRGFGPSKLIQTY